MNIYGVTFKDNGKAYYFKNEGEVIDKFTNVIVETEKGLQYGKIVSINKASEIEIDITAIKDIVRISDEKDYEIYLKNLKDASSALNNAKKIVDELNLRMLLIDAVFTFDRKQLLFNFTADERIDFRELAKRLAGIYRTRIELRQIGARDKAKEIGGIGQCGRELCCAKFLNHIDGVTMAMAKNQNLALNPTKINGQCGRLLCCLTYENEEYIECQKGIPYIGQSIKTDKGYGKVVSVDILNQKYKVDIDGTQIEMDTVKN